VEIQMKSSQEDKILFETEVGSIMWGMQTPESDHDIMQVYAQPTRDILSGKVIIKNKPHHQYKQFGYEWDYQFMEIGHLVNLLIKGNCNAIWMVTSPVVITDSDVLKKLRDLTVTNLSKASYDSINGLATSNFKDQEKRPLMRPNKAYKQCLRTLNFGTTLFETGELRYSPVTKEVDKNDIEDAFIRLNKAYENTKLINSPNEQVFRDFLYNLRIEGLK